MTGLSAQGVDPLRIGVEVLHFAPPADPTASGVDRAADPDASGVDRVSRASSRFPKLFILSETSWARAFTASVRPHMVDSALLSSTAGGSSEVGRIPGRSPAARRKSRLAAIS